MVRLDHSGASGGAASVTSPNSTGLDVNHSRQFTLIANSSAMRAYIDSLPEKLSLKDELHSYQFWKSLRTEFLVSFLYLIFGFGSLISLDPASSAALLSSSSGCHQLCPGERSLGAIVRNCSNSSELNHTVSTVPASLLSVANSLSSPPPPPTPQTSVVNDQVLTAEGSSSSSSLPSKHSNTETTTTATIASNSLPELKGALVLGLTVAALVQCAGHVSGCHLTIAITVGLFVSERVSSVRLASYLLVQLLGSLFGALVIWALFGFLPPVLPASTLSVAQIFGFEFLATFLVVLTYLANCDSQRTDLGFKALSIGFAFTVGHLFAYPYSGASLSPARTFAVSLLTQTWCLHWVYWVSPFVAGLIGGLTYEYIGSSKPCISSTIPINGNNQTSQTSGAIIGTANHNSVPLSSQPQYQTELRHKFTEKNPHPAQSSDLLSVHRRSSGSVSRSSSSTTQPSTVICGGGGLGGSTSFCGNNGGGNGCTGMLTPETYSLNETEFTSIGGFANDNNRY